MFAKFGLACVLALALALGLASRAMAERRPVRGTLKPLRMTVPIVRLWSSTRRLTVMLTAMSLASIAPSALRVPPWAESHVSWKHGTPATVRREDDLVEDSDAFFEIESQSEPDFLVPAL